eukprot:CAMPEP_0194032806 /NCGR_PEP_ID=MMETSP0009_2-20130614/5667_1 /TAXON_ID=210454 /ORGANISM="Grammatophora oceanica, Strain CCMP 410" /LENGTH=803 /DNA_ID=CAMNT_0038673355 /DNA_START=131 /DNA_END=2542 /DNA_ORIENTATION=-
MTNNSSTTSSTPNAWSRPLKTGPPPGLTKASSGRLATTTRPTVATASRRTPPPSAAAQATTATTSKEAAVVRERFLQLCLSMVGQRVTLSQTDGTVLEGVFHTVTPFSSQPADVRNKYVIKAVKVVKNGSNKKIANGSTVIVPTDKVARLHVASMTALDNNNNSSNSTATNGTKGESFLTDTEISRTGGGGRGHGLVAAGSAWTTPASTSASNGGGNSRAEALMGGGSDRPNSKGGGGGPTSGLRGHIGEWDQFKANEELFDVKASYDENLYTTELDKSQVDRSKMREAERMAREIETTASANIHVAEERNQVAEGDFDEEDRYSGVLNPKLKNRNEQPAPPKEKKQQQQPPPVSYKAALAAAAEAQKPTSPANPPPGLPAKPDKEKVEPAAPKAATTPPEAIKENPTPAAVPEEESPAPVTPDPSIQAAKDDAGKGKEPAEIEKEPKDAPPKNPEPKPDGRPKPKKEMSMSKLNPKAKSFSFNPSAKSFTPGFTPSAAPAPSAPSEQQQQQPMMDPNMQIAMPPMVGPYMQHPITGQPAMVPVMNHFPVHYQRPYPGMEHHMQPVPPQPQHVQQQQQQHSQDGAASPAADETNKSPGEAATLDGTTQPQPQHQAAAPVPQQGATAVPMQFGAPGYYGVPMQVPRPGQPIPGYPQMASAPQMPMVPGAYAAHHRHMYGIPHQPPPGAMRGPNNGYYSAGPQHYHYMMEGDDYRSGGRGGRGRGRGRIRKSGSGRGRGYYHNGGGRHSSHHGGMSSHSNSNSPTTAAPTDSSGGGGTNGGNSKDPTPAETTGGSSTNASATTNQ